MTAAAATKSISADYKVKDIGLAEWGRKEIVIAETEMPGLMSLLKPFVIAKVPALTSSRAI